MLCQMERHKCKLCSRTFPNGRALGGHMKAHLATLPLPPKPQPSFSFSSSSESEEEDDAPAHRESDEKSLIYGLRENPKKSFRLADPEFSFPVDTASAVVVQDRESETESKNPTRRRSKRNRKPIQAAQPKKPKLSFMESPTEPEPVSSVSNTSPEEDLAMCLMMLSRDSWRSNAKSNVVIIEEEEEEEQVEERSVEKSKGLIQEIKFRRVRGKHQCHNCGKSFRSSRALGSHKSICVKDETGSGNDKIFECPFCSKVFGSGQALGGHKRSHLIPSSSSTANNDSTGLKETFIDLNLPAPAEEDDLSVVSYA